LKLRRAVDVDHKCEPVDAQRPGEQDAGAAQARHRNGDGAKKRNQGRQQVAPQDKVLTTGRRAEGQDHGPCADDQRRRGTARIVAANQQGGEGEEDQQARQQRQSVVPVLPDEFAGLTDLECDRGVPEPPQHRISRDPVGVVEARLVTQERRQGKAGGRDDPGPQHYWTPPPAGAGGQQPDGLDRKREGGEVVTRERQRRGRRPQHKVSFLAAAAKAKEEQQ
jgi:hypothetical protein